MKLFVLSAIVLLSLSALPVWAQPTGSSMYNPIDAGNFGSSGSPEYWDYQNNSTYNGFGNTIGEYSDDVWYRFTISDATLINISLCGSDFDTYLHLVDEYGYEIESNDNNGPLCSGMQSSIQTTLSPGIYYAVAEGSSYNSGNINIEISNAGDGFPPLGDALATAIDAGSFGSCGSRSFLDNQNNSTSNGFGNKYGQWSDDIFYKLTINNTILLNISLCGSNFDTWLHLLDANGNEIESNDDGGSLCSGLQSSIQMTLSPGVYYVVAEGFGDNSGDIAIEISNTGSGTLPVGATLATAIDAGTLSGGFTDTKNNSSSGCYQNLMGQPSNEIYYKFTLTSIAEVSLSHCGSTIDTYMHLLNNSGTIIVSNDDNGPLCASYQSSIKMTLDAGTYYVVSEGYSTNSGDITTSLSAVIQNGGIISGQIVYTTYPINPDTRTLDITLPVGSTAGQASVTPTGGATYSIPIFSPPGTAGMQPNISLIYSSQSGNSIAGYGWDISASSAITRVPQTIYHNGVVKGVDFVDDRFALDGQRIINVSGIYGADFTTYNTETFDGSKIVSHGSLGGAPEWFEVLKKDGRIVEYGRTDDSRFKSQLPNQATILWNINKITDANGNYIQFVYHRSDIECYLTQIKYTGNNSVPGNNSINFYYYGARNDKTTGFIAGSRIEHNVLLDHVDVVSENQRIKTYKLKYIFDVYSKLNELEEYGKDNKKYNSTVIQWGENNPNIVVSTLPVPLPDNLAYIEGNNVKSWISSDLNRDGLTDLACLFKETKIGTDLKLETFICSLDSFGKPKFDRNSVQPLSDFAGFKPELSELLTSSLFRSLPVSFVDFEGNGNKVTIYPIRYEQIPSIIYFRREGKFDISCGIQQVGTVMPAISYADVNNDGIDEIIVVEKGVSNGKAIVHICYFKYFGYDASWDTISLNISSRPEDIVVQDFDGDGLKDILIATNNGINLYKNNGGGITTGNYTTVSFTTQSVLNTFNATYSAAKLGDFNGDGLMDFILNEQCNSIWKLAINNGNWGFDISPLTNITAIEEEFTDRNADKDDCIVTDFNNDGKDDVIIIDAVYVDPSHWYESSWGEFVKNNVTWYASTGTGFNVAKTFFTTDKNYTFNKFNTIGDFNGDGREELFTYGSDLYNGNSKTDVMYSHSSLNTNFDANLVKSITDGLGKKTQLSYLPLTHSNTPDNKLFYTKGTGSYYPVADIQMPLYCVSKLSGPNGIGGFNTTEFAYSEARAQLTGGGFLEFKSQTTSDAINNRKIVSTTDMNLTYCLPDKQTTDVSTTSGTAVSKTESYYSNTKTGSIYTSQPLQTVEHDYLNDLSKTTDYIIYDTYGNLKNVKTTQGDLISTQNTTYIQKGGWCPNKPETVTVTREQGTDSYTRSISYTYDDKGNRTKEITDPNDVNQKTVEYKDWNAFGLPTKTEMTANGILRYSSISYTPSGRFIQSKTDLLNQTTTYNWDEARGLLISEVNRLGTTTYTYNGMGQLTGTQYPDGTYKNQTTQWATTGNAFGALFNVYQEVSGGAHTYTWFDGLQRPKVQEVYGLNDKISRVFTQYRTDGKTEQVSAPTFNSQATTWDAIYDYDENGRVRTVTTPLGTSTTTYSGKTTTVSAPEGTRSTELNSAGQVQTSTVNGKTVTNDYYASGKLKTATPDGGQAVAMEYDLQGNRTKLTDPAAGMSTALYTGFGELKWEKQTNNAAQGLISTDYTYDDNTGQLLNRMRNGETTGYGYDALKRLWTVEITGQHKQTYTYGDYDRVSKLTELIGSRSFDKQLAYDSYGRITTETFPSGYYTLNHYDVYGNLTEVTDGSSRSIWKVTEANARGNITKEIKGAKETAYGYDENKAQLNSMIASGVVRYSFGYDTKNNLAYRIDNLINQKELFTYDALNRLTNWDIHVSTTNTFLDINSMTYDAMGNIETKSDLNITDAVTLKYELTTNPHALDSITGNPDAIPNDDLNVSYTDFRKIKTLTEGTKQYNITYGIDDQRRRTDYTSNDTTQTRYYLGDYEEESDNNGNVKKIHYLSGGAMLVQNNGAEKLYYGYTDNQGSLIALTDTIGNVIEKYAYDPWGGRRNPDDWQLKDTRSSFITNRGYTGHEHIDAFNIINMNGRVYDPVTAMFFSPDPFIQSPENWMNYNRYSYVMNNPTRSTDPTGYYMAELKEEKDESRDMGILDGGGGGGPTLGGVYNRGTSAAWNANGSEVFGSWNGSAAIRVLSQINNGFTLYRFDLSNGNTTYVSSIGDIGIATVHSNGGLSYSNPTAGQIFIAMWGNESGGSSNNSTNVIDKINTGVGAFMVANGIKEQLISYAARISDLGATGTSYLKMVRGAGIVGGVFGMGVSGYHIYNDYSKSGSIKAVNGWDVTDVGVGAASLGATIFLASNPIGWIIVGGGTIYFGVRLIYDAANKN